MVKIGFIVEGATEKIILERSDLFKHLNNLKVDFVKEVIDAEGNGNLLPHNIKEHTEILEKKGASIIFILTDLDKDKCITETKTRIKPQKNHIVVINKKEIESWFLSDSQAISKFFKDPSYTCSDPESITEPFEEIRATRLAKCGIGVSSKTILANQMVVNGFSIQKAANHPNCTSAKYFLKKIIEISKIA